MIDLEFQIAGEKKRLNVKEISLIVFPTITCRGFPFGCKNPINCFTYKKGATMKAVANQFS
jgi:hypothetical protein